MNRDPIDDWESRLSIANREAADHSTEIRLFTWILAIGAAGLLAAAHLLGASLPWLIITAAALVILALGYLLKMVAVRSDRRAAFTEMTCTFIEDMLKRVPGAY